MHTHVYMHTVIRPSELSDANNLTLLNIISVYRSSHNDPAHACNPSLCICSLSAPRLGMWHEDSRKREVQRLQRHCKTDGGRRAWTEHQCKVFTILCLTVIWMNNTCPTWHFPSNKSTTRDSQECHNPLPLILPISRKSFIPLGSAGWRWASFQSLGE